MDSATGADLLALLRFVRDWTGAATASLFQLDRSRRELLFSGASFGEPRTPPRRFRLGEGMVGQTALRGRPLVSHSPASDPRVDPALPPSPDAGALACTPLASGSEVTGVLNLRFPARRPAPSPLDLLRISRSTSALLDTREPAPDWIDLHAAQDAQRALLPTDGDHDGLSTRIVHRPANAAGGDLVAVLPRPAGILLAIGDVCGHDTGSALVAAQVTGMLRTLAAGGLSPASILASLDRTLARTTGPRWFTTLLLCELTRGHRTMRLAGAGHVSGWLLGAGPDSEPTRLRSQGPPLGLGRGRFMERPGPLAPDDTLLLWTDGLEDALRAATSEPAQALSPLGGLPIDAARECLWELLADRPEGEDDATALLVRRCP